MKFSGVYVANIRAVGVKVKVDGVIQCRNPVTGATAELGLVIECKYVNRGIKCWERWLGKVL